MGSYDIRTRLDGLGSDYSLECFFLTLKVPIILQSTVSSQLLADKQVNRMVWTQEQAGAAANNLYQMNRGAEVAGIDIQYCMSTPRIAMTSLECQQVTHARYSVNGNQLLKINLKSFC